MGVFKNPLLNLKEYIELENFVENSKNSCLVTDLTDSSKAHFISSLLVDKRPFKLVISYEETKARQIYNDLSSFNENVFLYPAKDLLFFMADVSSHLITKERINIWKNLSTLDNYIVVCTIDALMDKVVEYSIFKSKIIYLNIGNNISLEDFSYKLVNSGYERVEEVEGIAQFSIKGGIIDIFPINSLSPIRVELWDDEIDTIRIFDINSKRSIENIESFNIYPAKEELGILNTSFLSYFPKDTLIFVDEFDNTYERAVYVEKEYCESYSIDKENTDLFSADNIISILKDRDIIALSLLGEKLSHIHVNRVFSIPSKSVVSYSNAFNKLIEELQKLKKRKYKTVIFTASRTRADRLAKNLREYDLLAFTSDKPYIDIKESEILVSYGNIKKGFEYENALFMLISESDIYGTKKAVKKNISSKSKVSISLNELNVGDYVVHENYGIAIYKGIEIIERDGVAKDYIKLAYADNANYYISATKLDLIQKYNTNGIKPKLSKLSGTEWRNTKSKVKKAVEDVAKDLVVLYAKRLNSKGFKYSKDTIWQREFEEMFPFEETKDQLKAIEDIKADMESNKIMDRLVCGDVGYGKTELAIRAAFKAVMDSKQVIYLVPTTILARQHYNSFIQRMKDFPIKIEMLSRFISVAKEKQIFSEFKAGQVDIIIGTHKVLSKNLLSKDLGLIIIDEEQRFGVKHKETLKEFRDTVDVLTLTATPIPRTLHMSLVGIRDLSVLEEAPIDRLPIQTYVLEYNEFIIKDAINREIARNGQVYYVYNVVNNIADIAYKIQSLVPNARVAYAHGQMNERELEKVMLDFINSDIDVLVSTTIIETGLDIPNANTMIIHDADKFGLSQLYQLRGRIGRSSRTSYAFMLYKPNKLLKEEAAKRLKAIKEFTELGSGIKIAMKDLEIRGAGNVLGAKQHGHMQAVGYELYRKLLSIAIKELKGEDISKTNFETNVEINIDAYIPGSYIKNEELRLDIYKKIAGISNKEDYMDIQDELIDRFLEYPKEVDNLIEVAYVKALAHENFIEEVFINKQEIKFTFIKEAKTSNENILTLMNKYKNQMKLKNNENFTLEYTHKEKNIDLKFMLLLAKDMLISLLS